MNSTAWKTAIVMLVLLTAGPAAILLFNGLRSDGGSGGGISLGFGSNKAQATAVVATPTPLPIICPGGDRFEVRNASIEAADDCCTTSVVGQITNNCNTPLVGTVSAALRLSSSGKILAVSNADKTIGTLGSGETTFFRVDLSGKSGWDASQRRDVRVDVQVRSTLPDATE